MTRIEGAGSTGSAAGFVNSRESVCCTDWCVSDAGFATGNDSDCGTDQVSAVPSVGSPIRLDNVRTWTNHFLANSL